MYDFDVVKPATVAEAVSALGQDEAQPLSGGLFSIRLIRIIR